MRGGVFRRQLPGRAVPFGGNGQRKEILSFFSAHGGEERGPSNVGLAENRRVLRRLRPRL